MIMYSSRSILPTLKRSCYKIPDTLASPTCIQPIRSPFLSRAFASSPPTCTRPRRDELFTLDNTTNAIKSTSKERKDGSTADQLSNRQKFKQIDPPLRLYERLERLGFGTLRRTKRYQSVRQQKTKDKHPIPDPEYKVCLFPSCANNDLTSLAFPSCHSCHSLRGRKHLPPSLPNTWKRWDLLVRD